jgi:uncharacterized BrkB/YihY/UPF0761 family membrane protein
VFLMWLWIFDIALLLGVEVNQEVLRRRKLRNSEEVDHARQEGP